MCLVWIALYVVWYHALGCAGWGSAHDHVRCFTVAPSGMKVIPRSALLSTEYFNECFLTKINTLCIWEMKKPPYRRVQTTRRYSSSAIYISIFWREQKRWLFSWITMVNTPSPVNYYDEKNEGRFQPALALIFWTSIPLYSSKFRVTFRLLSVIILVQRLSEEEATRKWISIHFA